MKLYCKWLSKNKYSEVGVNENGDYYIINKVQVQRGMGHQLANELLIVGVPKKHIQEWCERNKCLIVGREDEVPEEDLLIENSKEEARTNG